MRLFFATDLHGSNVAYKKFLAACNFYEADNLILGGDVTGKGLLPIIELSGERWLIGGEKNSESVLQEAREVERARAEAYRKGFYVMAFDREEWERRSSQADMDELFRCAVERGLRKWREMSEDLPDACLPIYWCPGNDDPLFVEDVLAPSQDGPIVNTDSSVVEFGSWWVIGLSCSTPTPWNTPRECTEDVIYEKLVGLLDRVQKSNRTILNVHVPPKGVGLDRAPALKENGTVKLEPGGSPETLAGSYAVREVVEEYQPALGLFGHLHGSRGFARIGKTLCVNPGSEVERGILNGCVVELNEQGVVDFQLTSG